MVYLRLQPYHQSSLALDSSTKLAPRFYGPHKVIDKIGTVAYNSSFRQMHEFIRCSMYLALKKKIDGRSVQYSLLGTSGIGPKGN